MSVPFRSKTSAAAVLRRLTNADEHAPLSAMIEIADRCNEVCVHCYQIQGQKGEIGTDDWRSVLDQLAEMGVLFLTISGGEATLRKDFLQIVEHARARKFAVKIFTNGLTMTEEMADEMARLAVQEVQISIYSPREEVHDWVTGVPGSFRRSIAGAKRLVERGVAVVIKSMVTSFNFEDRHRYIELADRVGADFMFDGMLDPREDGDRGPQSFSITDEQWLALRRDPALFRRPRQEPDKPLDRSVCGACSGAVHVEPNGEIRPCTQLDVPIGNALKDGVAAAWSNGEASRAIRQLTWADLHGCRDCDLHPLCNRCFANARKEGGDALGPYRSACRRARLRYELVHGQRPSVMDVEGRDGGIGPYRIREGHRLEPIEDRATPRDEALASRLGWTRGLPATPAVATGPGQLVQIRRPGARRARAERVPGPTPHRESVDRAGDAGHTCSGLE